MLSLLVTICVYSGLFVAQAQLPQDIEIQFEPAGPMIQLGGGGNAPPKELLELLGAGMPEGPQASRNPKEAQLDKELFHQLSKGPSPQHHPHPHFLHHRPHFVGNPFAGSMAGPQVVMEIGGGPSPFTPAHSAFPATMFRDLFPGPVGFDIAQGHPVPFNEPDPLVQNLMKDLDRTFVGLMGSISKAAGADRTPNSCANDIKQNCQNAKSKLHCLGQHASSISEACHKDIGKSVPFRCSNHIDKFCDVMEVGILQCLGDHMSDLKEECKDAVLATHHVISKANTQTAAVVDTSTGAKKVSEPSASVTPPPALQGAPPAHATPVMLPPSVLEVLGVARSLSDKLQAGSAESTWQTIKEWSRLLAILTVLAFVVCRLPPTSWPERKLRGMFGMHCKEDECLMAARSGPVKPSGQNLELPLPVDPAFA